MLEKQKRQGNTAKRREGILGEVDGGDVKEHDGSATASMFGIDVDEEPKSDELVAKLMDAMRNSSVFAALGTKILEQAIAHLQEQSCVSKQIIFSQVRAVWPGRRCCRRPLPAPRRPMHLAA